MKVLDGKTCSVCFLLLTLAIMLLSSCAPGRYETIRGTRHAVASWYGQDFHGKPTSSGELFDMYALTCAHREYPFGTKVKVTNILNNKSVYCLVNDRGPFVSGRDLDLSYAAAKEIDLIGQGVGEVLIEHAGRNTQYIREVRYLSHNGPFTIQVGSFKEPLNALRLKTALELKYKTVYIAEAEIGSDRLYRVRIGKFIFEDEANRLAKLLADEGYSALIVKYDERI